MYGYVTVPNVLHFFQSLYAAAGQAPETRPDIEPGGRGSPERVPRVSGHLHEPLHRVREKTPLLHREQSGEIPCTAGTHPQMLAHSPLLEMENQR